MAEEFEVSRQNSWNSLSTAATRQLNLPQFSSKLRNLTYHDKYVIHYEVKGSDLDQAVAGLAHILDAVHGVGLHAEVRAGYGQSLLVFVQAPEEILTNTVYKSRIRDWLHGTTAEHPGRQEQVAENINESENLLALHHLIVWPQNHDGACITPGHGKFKGVTSVFPLHNPTPSLSLLRHFSKRLYLSDTDFDKIRDLFGSKTAFYFAFTQMYILFLFFPAVTGILVWLFLPPYSPIYALMISVWGVVFVECWKMKETDLSIRWGVEGVGALKVDRPQFIYEMEVVDETGRVTHLNPGWKQFTRQLLQIPFLIAGGLSLGLIILVMFAAGVLISETYTGPYILYLELIPTAILAMPWPTQFLESVAAALTEFENHQTADVHERSLAQKVFLFSCITQYLPILLTAFLYVPFGATFIPWMQDLVKHTFGDAAKFRDTQFNADENRLPREVIALTITGQIFHFAEEFFFPLAYEALWTWYRNYTDRSHEHEDNTIDSDIKDDPAEGPFLRSARAQAHLPPYDVQQDIAQMVTQFGYLALFSPVWPLVPVGFLVSNWIELRSDFLKICIEHQRPPPLRTDGIAPWVQNLELLSWLGSISAAAICHIFHCKVSEVKDVAVSMNGASCTEGWWTLPLTIVLSEHGFLFAKEVARSAVQAVGSEQIRKKEKDNYLRRKRYLKELEAAQSGTLGSEREQRERRKSVMVAAGDPFWTKQLEDGKSLKAGTLYIKKMIKPKGKKAK